MARKEIKITIKNKEEDSNYKVNSIIEDEIIKYKEPNNTIVKYDYNKNTLVRENDEFRMDYVFRRGEKTEGTIRVKEINKVLNLPIETKKIIRKNNNIEILFSISDDEFLYKIEEIV